MFVSHDSPRSAGAAAELGLDELERQISELATHINAATCRWLSLVAEFDRRAGHERFGFVSCSSWLAWRCSITPRAAREQLRVARALADLPGIRASFASGALSYSKVRALTRVAEPEMEAELTELALEATAAQLERLMRGYRGAIMETEERVSERRHLSTSWDEDGGLIIRGYLRPEEGALLLKALELSREAMEEEARDPSSVEDAAEDPRRPRVTNADALLGVAESAIARGAGPASGGDRHQVVVHVDAADLTAVRGGAAAECGEGFLPVEAVRRLGCDASVVMLVERDGRPLSAGRKTRSVPPAIARALRSRDRGCRFPGCGRERWVDAHHVQHWAHGGETSLDNLIQLCRHHHRLVHEGGFAVAMRQGEPVFRRPDGRRIVDSPQTDGGRVGGAMEAARSSGRRRPESCRPRSAGEPFDLDLAVLSLAGLHDRRCCGDRHGAAP